MILALEKIFGKLLAKRLKGIVVIKQLTHQFGFREKKPPNIDQANRIIHPIEDSLEQWKQKLSVSQAQCFRLQTPDSVTILVHCIARISYE